MFARTVFKRLSVLKMEGNAMVVNTPYHPSLIASIKALPVTERKYDPSRKCWLVDPKHGARVADWIKDFLGEDVQLPLVTDTHSAVIKQRLQVRYIGTCKMRQDGSSCAYGLMGTEWGVIFPEQVLRDFFDGSKATPGERESYFSLLGVSRSASDEEISTGFRRMAKLWHPDVCKEANAAEVFMRIKAAYDVLKDADTRAMYEAGLALEALIGQEPLMPSANDTAFGYRSPLRSGMILVEGVRKLSLIEVTKIFTWDDIVVDGKTLVVSWPQGAKEPVEEWI